MKGRIHIYIYRKWKHIKWWNLEDEDEEEEEEKEVVGIGGDDEEIESEIEQEKANENEEKGVVEIDDKAEEDEEDEADGDGDENKEDAIQVLKNNCQKHRWKSRFRWPPISFEIIIFSHSEGEKKRRRKKETFLQFYSCHVCNSI